MGHELAIVVGFTIFSLFVTAAWVGGYLDPYQKELQNLVLDKMGDNRASYGIKSKENVDQADDLGKADLPNRRCICTEDRGQGR